MNYKCAYCDSVHSADEWNHATAVQCNEGKEPVPAPLPDHHGDDETLFHCPSCSVKNYGDELSIVVGGEADPQETIMIGRISRK